MRRWLEWALGAVFISLVWFVAEFLAGVVFVLGAMLFVALDQLAGRVGVGVLAGAAGGLALGLAPSWLRPAFVGAVALMSATGFALERATGFIASQVYQLGAPWAAFSLAAFGAPILEAMIAPPKRSGAGAWRVVFFLLAGAVVGGLAIPRSDDIGPLAMRLTFLLSHLVWCGLARSQDLAQGGPTAGGGAIGGRFARP